MALDVEAIGENLITEAIAVAQADWEKIKQVAVLEFRSLAQRIALIGEGYVAGELSKKMARRYMKTARFHVVAIMAMMTSLLEATVEKIVRKAIKAVKTIVNDYVGFALLV